MAIQRFRPVKASIGGTRDGSALAREMKAIEDNFKSWTLHITNQAGEVLRSSLQPTLEKAQAYCPAFTGALRRSGYVEIRRVGLLRGWEAEIGFAKNNFPDYAIYVHERPGVFHAPPTRWKFLQAALEEDGPEIQRRIRDGFKIASGT